MDNEFALLPCPFCGGTAVFVTKGNSSTHHSFGCIFEIECKDCGVKLPKQYQSDFYLTDDGRINGLNDTRADAVKEWNRRCQNSENKQ